MKRAILLGSLLLIVPESICFSNEKKRPLMKDFVGLNGHFKFKPELYKKTCRLARNYHNLNWDVKKPGDTITFPTCPNKVNWNTHVYGKWKAHGFETDLCAMFGSFGRGQKGFEKLWDGQEKWTYDYGYRMAQYFGPSGKEKLVTSIEIGNEPGNEFDDALYRRIFTMMAKGIRAADKKVKIVTCTAHARASDKYSKDLRETFASPEIKKLYDVINVHTYATKPKKKGQSPWDRSYPEDPTLDYLKVVDETITWRDAHGKGKEIWVTEFGYDACTPEAMKKRTGWGKKLNWQGVTDLQQAQYLIRSILAFAKRDVDRAYIYFYDDNDKASVHAAAGLTRNFKPKQSFWAVKQFYEILGDYRLKRVVKESEKLCTYEFTNEKADVIWVAWIPTGSGKTGKLDLRSLPVKVKYVVPVATSSKNPVNQPAKGVITVSESPTYVIMEK